MDDTRTSEPWLAAAVAEIKRRPAADAVKFLATFLALPPPPSGPSRTRAGRRRQRPVPSVLYRGLDAVNRLRQAAAEAIHQRSARTAPISPPPRPGGSRGDLPPAFPARYAHVRGVRHAPAWCLPRLDELGAQALMTWSMTLLGTRSAAQAAAAVQIPDLPLRDALLIGSVAWRGSGPVALALLLEQAAGLGLSRAAAGVRARVAAAAGVAGSPPALPVDAGRAEGCFLHFFDQSPAATARACSRAHAVRLAESRPRPP